MHTSICAYIMYVIIYGMYIHIPINNLLSLYNISYICTFRYGHLVMNKTNKKFGSKLLNFCCGILSCALIDLSLKVETKSIQKNV